MWLCTGFVKDLPGPGHLRDTFVGTPDYASVNALLGSRQGAADDIESLGYALLEMYLGGWGNSILAALPLPVYT